MVLMSALLAMEIILSRFLSFSVWNMKIGFAFVPIVIAAILLGPVKAAIVNALADLMGAILFPIGAYFPGFTFTAALTGFVFGAFLYKKQTLPRILSAVGINQLILSLLLNTLWISILYNTKYLPILITRLTQVALLVPVQIVVITLISKTITGFAKRRKQAIKNSHSM
jgi:ECF transporter S component (folate family)